MSAKTCQTTGWKEEGQINHGELEFEEHLMRFTGEVAPKKKKRASPADPIQTLRCRSFANSAIANSASHLFYQYACSA
ncbi:MAG: hypothetical protein CMO80_13805 [Verrucomicrobiales bacterium]|nr:hypothetical protein [Verrucomicrobiales bacterium]|tara:strand:- start:5121 stop:5354 length:234 start_codon:yes stop_codon:yes gene_type:complete